MTDTNSGSDTKYFPLRPGDVAPDFSLEYVLDGEISWMTLSSYSKDKFCLIIFYPVDFGYVTPTEFYQLEPLLPELEKLNCAVIAISTDHIVNHVAWQTRPMKEGGLNNMKIPLCSDTDGVVSRQYGVYKEKEHIAFHGTFLLSPDRKILSVEKCDLPVGCCMDEQLRQVQSAVAVANAPSKGYYTPADWQQGDKVEVVKFSV